MYYQNNDVYIWCPLATARIFWSKITFVRLINHYSFSNDHFDANIRVIPRKMWTFDQKILEVAIALGTRISVFRIFHSCPKKTNHYDQSHFRFKTSYFESIGTSIVVARKHHVSIIWINFCSEDCLVITSWTKGSWILWPFTWSLLDSRTVNFNHYRLFKTWMNVCVIY